MRRLALLKKPRIRFEGFKALRSPRPVLVKSEAPPLSIAPIVVWSLIEQRITARILFAGLWPLPFYLLFEWRNRRLTRDGQVPLIVKRDLTIWYFGKCVLADYGMARNVSVASVAQVDDPTVYDVIITDRMGNRVELPFPFFARLSAIEAAMLAKLLANAISAPLINEISPHPQTD